MTSFLALQALPTGTAPNHSCALWAWLTLRGLGAAGDIPWAYFGQLCDRLHHVFLKCTKQCEVEGTTDRNTCMGLTNSRAYGYMIIDVCRWTGVYTVKVTDLLKWYFKQLKISWSRTSLALCDLLAGSCDSCRMETVASSQTLYKY